MYYGWKIVGATFVTLFISVGFIFYSYGVFFEALELEFGGGRFNVSVGIAIMNVTMGLLAPFLGRWVDRWSIRNIMLIGAIAMPLGFFLASRVTAIWQFYVLLATLMGAGAALIGQLPSSTLVANWFIRRRGTALGIATMGVSMSGVFMPPVSTYLIQEIGWRHTFVVYGILTIVIVMPLVRAFVVNRPEDLGLLPDGDRRPGDSGDGTPVFHEFAGEEMQWTTMGIFRERNFWAITVTVGLCFFSMGATLIHMIRLASDRGIPPTSAAFVLSICAAVGVLGKVLFGWIADHIDTRIALWLAISFQAVGTVLIMRAFTYPVLMVAGGVFGLGMGGIVPLWGSLVGEVFGRASFGRVMGMMSPCMLPIQALGVPYAGLVFDRTGSYTIAFRTFLVAYATAASVLFLLRQQDVDQRIKEAAEMESALDAADPISED